MQRSEVELLPAEMRARPRLPVEEMPGDLSPGGRNATLGRGPVRG
jgi:hypothetical protein